jgi:hypothetical protein
MRLLRQWSTWALCTALFACGGEEGKTFQNTGGTGATGSGGSGGIKDGGGGIITTGGSGGVGGGGGIDEDAKICGGAEATV